MKKKSKKLNRTKNRAIKITNKKKKSKSRKVKKTKPRIKKDIKKSKKKQLN